MAGGDSDTIDNAEMQMREQELDGDGYTTTNGKIQMHIQEDEVDCHFEGEGGNVNVNSASCDEIAADLAYIMQSAFTTSIDFEASPENIDTSPENDSSANNSESDDDDVKIILVKNSNTVNEIITLSSTSEDEISVVDDGKICNLRANNTKRKTGENIKSNKECEKSESDGNVKKVVEEVSDECSSSEDETVGPPTLISIIRNERRVVDSVPRVQNEVLPDEVVVNVEEVVLSPEDNLNQLGSICRAMEKKKIVIVASNQDAPALDAESAFFTEDRTYLGKVFETFGPVKIPYYTVHLSSQVDDSKVTIGTKVYFVPFNQKLTNYVFVEQLKKLKGSDASWRDDCEPPVQYLDFSDDEGEQLISDTGEKHPQSQTQNRNKNRHSNNRGQGNVRHRGLGSTRKPGGNNHSDKRRQGSTWTAGGSNHSHNRRQEGSWKPGVNNNSHNHKNSHSNRRHGSAWKPGMNDRNSRFHNHQQNCEMNDNIQFPNNDSCVSQPIEAVLPQFMNSVPCPSQLSGPPVPLMQNIVHVPHANRSLRPPVPPRPPVLPRPVPPRPPFPPGNRCHPPLPQTFENGQHLILNVNQNQFRSQGDNQHSFRDSPSGNYFDNQHSFQDSRNSKKKEIVNLNGFTFKI